MQSRILQVRQDKRLEAQKPSRKTLEQKLNRELRKK